VILSRERSSLLNNSDFKCFKKSAMNCFVSARLVEHSTLSVPQRRRPACRTQYECAELVAENCPQTAANAKISQVVRRLRGTAVLKLSEVCMSVQFSVSHIQSLVVPLQGTPAVKQHHKSQKLNFQYNKNVSQSFSVITLC